MLAFVLAGALCGCATPTLSRQEFFDRFYNPATGDFQNVSYVGSDKSRYYFLGPEPTTVFYSKVGVERKGLQLAEPLPPPAKSKGVPFHMSQEWQPERDAYFSRLIKRSTPIEQHGPADGSKPSRSGTNSTSGAAGSRR
ncbi:MAG: hypothetical protein NT154_15795 [Verrucomicrobia bacterium]|nr:hypothetical protein [Verrucomicrobiota bacterium]